jgi:hypothetical protein
MIGPRTARVQVKSSGLAVSVPRAFKMSYRWPEMSSAVATEFLRFLIVRPPPCLLRLSLTVTVRAAPSICRPLRPIAWLGLRPSQMSATTKSP